MFTALTETESNREKITTPALYSPVKDPVLDQEHCFKTSGSPF